MRSVPHRVVCLVGLDDGVFPRSQWTDGDDALARDPLTGERDVRSEDRQLLLDAVLAARDTLVICFTGAGEHTGALRPPAVPLGELLDAVHATVDGADVVVRHPLQPHDPRNLTAPSPFSFDSASLAGARAVLAEPTPPAPFLPTPLPRLPAGDVNLDELVRFLLHPVREFLRGPMALGTARESDDVLDGIPIDLTALEEWDIGDRFVSSLLAGGTPGSVFLAEQLRGSVPPGQIGEAALTKITTEVQALLVQTADLRSAAPRTLDLDVGLGGGRRLTGTVAGVFGNRLVSIGYSRLRARQRLTSWVRLLALSAAHPDQSWTAHTVGRGKAGPAQSLAGPFDHRAEQWLVDLVALYDEGQTRPLPVPLKTGCAWADTHAAELLGDPRSAVDVARREWTTDRFHPLGITAEDADAWHELVWGSAAPLETLLDEGLGDLAWRIWEPLVSGSERVGPL